MQAISAVGTSLPSASLYEGRSSFATRNAPVLCRPWAYSTGCSCFRFTGNAQPLS